MKTSEFISKVKSLHYEYDVSTVKGFIYIKTYFGTTCARVYTKGRHVLLDTDNTDLAKLCIEYAETPILERIDVKKYIAKIPDPENLSTERIYTLVRAFNGNIMISRPQTKRILENEAYHLTEEEIKRNHAYLWQFAEEVVK